MEKILNGDNRSFMDNGSTLHGSVELLHQVPHLPRPAFVKTEKYHEVLEALDARNGVVHIYGMSGNGKSQIMLSACKEYVERKVRSVRCFNLSDGRSLFSELKKFAKEIATAHYITDDQNAHVLADLDKGGYEEFFTLLKQVRIPVLFAVEVGILKDKSALQHFIQHVMADRDLSQIVQFLIASNKKDAVFIEQDLQKLTEYKTIKIFGFSEDEAKAFLLSPPNPAIGTKGVENLAAALAYSPLRLTLAKAYCEKNRVTYESYYNKLGKDEQIIAKEKELMREHPELGEAHGYEVIMKALEPNPDEPRKDDESQFNVIKMMSFVSNDDIPDVLLGRFFQEMQRLSVDDEETEVKHLVSRLETDCDMDVHEMPHPQDYGHQLYSMHKDILNAVRFSMQGEKSVVLTKVLHAVISLIDKDNRTRGKSNLLVRLMQHTEQLVKYAREFLKAEFDIKKPKSEEFEVQMCLGRLYELSGFSSTQHATSRDGNFEKAIEYVWLIASSYSGLSIFDCFKKKEGRGMLEYEQGKDPKKTAQKAYERIKKASQKIPEKYITDHYAKHFPLGTSGLEDMKNALGGQRGIEWDQIERELSSNRSLSEDSLGVLQTHRMILTPSEMRKVFLSERIASILHSRGRQVLYLKNDVPPAEQDRYEWYTSLGLELTRVMANDTGIKTAFEYIIEANNKLPRMLQIRNGEDDAAFLERLREARDIAKRLKEDGGDLRYYENGVYKKMLGTPYSDLNALKYIIKANTKMYKITDPTFEERAEGLRYCDELFDLSKRHAAKYGVASSCMIHAGKYYAAAHQREKAFEAFEAGFSYEGKGIKDQQESNVNIFAWALYNTGRAIYEFCSETPNREDQVRRFLRRYGLIEGRYIPPNLRNHLEAYVEEFKRE